MEGTLTQTPVTTTNNPWGQGNMQSTGVSPWGKKTDNVPCSLEDVMSEQLASQLQRDEEHVTVPTVESTRDDVDPEIQALIDASSSDTDTSSDVALARMLQVQFDKEHNKHLQLQENHVNRHSKVTISFENFKSPHPAFVDDEESDDENVEEYDDTTPWDEDTLTFNNQGYSGTGKNITTKHDSVICGRKNASKLMDFPPEFESGDGEGMDMKLPNNVYNKLKRHSEAENKRSQRLHDKKEQATAEQAMDPRTRLLLYKMVNNGTLESLSGSISTGKESVVFHAYGGKLKDEPLSHEVAIKVFKTTLNEFKNRERYVHGDHRFSKDDYKKQNPRKIIKMWAMKEAANLNRMGKFNVPCPRVQLIRNHVLVMTFIGDGRTPAPKLKDVKLPTQDWQDAYDQVIKVLKTIYRECGLVHADLSEYNMLWYKDKVWIIDVSQAVDITHPSAFEFLHRDCGNVSKFFKKNGVHDVFTAEEMFNEITQLNIKGTGADFLSQVQCFVKEKREELLANQSGCKNYQFDFFFEKSLKEREEVLPQLQTSLSDSDSDEGDIVKE